jgi:hypothetical protein
VRFLPDGRSHLVVWDDPEVDPRAIVALPPRASGLVASPAGIAVVSLATPTRDDGALSSRDPLRVVTVDLASGQVGTLVEHSASFELMMNVDPLLSPEGRRVAISGRHVVAGEKTGGVIVLGPGASRRATPAALDVYAQAWAADGIRLKCPGQRRGYLWDPDEGAPSALATGAPYTSPAGDVRVAYERDRIAISGRVETTLRARAPDQRVSFRQLADYPPVWLDEHRLVVGAQDDVIRDHCQLIDVRDASVRPMFAPGIGLGYASAGSGGRVAAYFPGSGLRVGQVG